MYKRQLHILVVAVEVSVGRDGGAGTGQQTEAVGVLAGYVEPASACGGIGCVGGGVACGDGDSDLSASRDGVQTGVGITIDGAAQGNGE